MLSELASSVHRGLVMIGAVYLALLVMIAIMLGITAFFLFRMGTEFFRFRGSRKILCPETGSLATIRIGALDAAVSSLLDDPELRVSDCSRWPERQGCGQECLRPIQTCISENDMEVGNAHRTNNRK